MSDFDFSYGPIRLCCGQQHWSVDCPDGLVMCCYCFDLWSPSYLWVDPTDGKKVDICRPCKETEEKVMRERGLL